MSVNDSETQVQTKEPEGPAQTKIRRWPRVLFIVGLVLALAAGGGWGFSVWQKLARRIGTDDAYVAADISQITPQVTGMVKAVYVRDNQIVKTGDLLVELDASTFRVAVAQAQANLQAVIAQAQAAGVSVSLTSETGDAQLAQARGGVEQAESAIRGYRADLGRAVAGVDKASAGAKAAQSAIATAQAGVEVAQANQQRAQAAVDTAEAQVANAKAGVRAARAAVSEAEVAEEKASRDARRYAALNQQGAVSEQVAQDSVSAVQVAQAQVESTQAQLAQAESAVAARQADVAAARQQVQAAVAGVTQAQAQLAAAGDGTAASQADIRSAAAARQAADETIRQAQGHRTTALGQLQQAQTGPRQVAVSAGAHAAALAKISQAQATLQAAQLDLQHTRLYAPVSGQVSAKSVEVGMLAQPLTPLMAIVQRGQLWVVANYKETQLAGTRAGQTAEISVDALNGKLFHGHVDSIAAGTGSTFALLPPENASGNFTKVVQRVPVRIELDNQPDLDRLRAGLSVHATIITR